MTTRTLVATAEALSGGAAVVKLIHLAIALLLGFLVHHWYGTHKANAPAGTITVSADLATGQHVTLSGSGKRQDVVAVANATLQLLGEKQPQPGPEPRPPIPPEPLPAPTPSPLPNPAPGPSPLPPIPVPAPPKFDITSEVHAWAIAVVSSSRAADAAKLRDALTPVIAALRNTPPTLTGTKEIVAASSKAIRGTMGLLELRKWEAFSVAFQARTDQLQAAKLLATDADWLLALTQTQAGLEGASK